MRGALLARRVVTLLGVGGVVLGGLGGVPVEAAPRTVDSEATWLSPPEGEIPDLAAEGWLPVLDENFDGTELDTSIWRMHPGRPPAGVDVENGHLRLSAYTENGTNLGGGIQTGRAGADQISTPSGFEATYGYVEASISMPAPPSTATRPNSGMSFWVMSHNGNSQPFGDPAASGPELDVVEHGNKPWNSGDTSPADGACDSRPATGVPCTELFQVGEHWDGFDQDHKLDHDFVGSPSWDPAAPDPAATSLQGNFHTYGLLWTPEGYRYYLDGKEVFRSGGGMSYTPEWFLLTMYPGDGGSYGNLGDPANDVALVDYVRVWQRPISAVPDQRVTANRPVAIPFTVTDYAYSSTAPNRAEPESVNVTASVLSGTSVVPADNVVVTGNGPADPDGSFGDGTFEPGAAAWSFPDLNGPAPGTGNTATVWNARAQTPPNALHVEQAGGRAEQTITGLQPNTTYVIGAFYDLELGYTDSNGNGRIDVGEPLTESGDTLAAFDWGVTDVDSSLAGNQAVQVKQERNTEPERKKVSWWRPETWPEERLTFTTGPTTTQVTLFVSNQAYAATTSDSAVTIDSLYLRPLIPPTRTVTVRPANQAQGSAVIRLTATQWLDADNDNVVDSGEEQVFTEDFTLTFVKGTTFTNGDFEAMPAGAGWELLDGDDDNNNGHGVDVVVDNPFVLNHVLELAGPGLEPVANRRAGTAFQTINDLTPGAMYDITVTGQGDVVLGVTGYSGSNPCTGEACHIVSSSWSTKTVRFTAATTNATFVVSDWITDEVSLVDNIQVVPVVGEDGPPVSSPTLSALAAGTHTIPSSAPFALSFNAGDIAKVSSSNPDVIPDRNIGVRAAGGSGKVLSLTPLPDRTGPVTITVELATGSQTSISVVVSDRRFLNPGFEYPTAFPWTVTSGATFVTGNTGKRSGTTGLQITGTGAATQVLPVDVTGIAKWDCNITYVVGGWAKGNARLEVRAGDSGPPLAVVQWSGAAWTEAKTTFTSVGCWGTSRRDLQLTLTSPGGAQANVDDLYMTYAPAFRTPRDISIPQGATAFDPVNARRLYFGRVPMNGILTAEALSLTSSDTSVLPAQNMQFYPPDQDPPVPTEATWPFMRDLYLRGGAATGRSDVTVQLTDPRTGVQTARTITVTVNAGTNFNNGDFERILAGWIAGRNDVSHSWDVRERRPEQTPSPQDHDQVLRLSNGVTAFRVSGLAVGSNYVLKAAAFGNGAKIRVVPNDTAGCLDASSANTPCLPATSTQTLGEVSVNASTWAATPDLPVQPGTADVPSTPGNESDVWILLVDDGTGQAGPSADPCRVVVTGEACIDDIGMFAA